MYELYEGTTPFGTSESDETSVFKAISSYFPNKLQFNSQTSNEAQALIKQILQYDGGSRAGYKNEESIKEAEYFSGIFSSVVLYVVILIFLFSLFLGISWDQLERHKGHPVDIQPAIEISVLLDDPTVKDATTSDFDHF
jgi:hypothetical protein